MSYQGLVWGSTFRVFELSRVNCLQGKVSTLFKIKTLRKKVITLQIADGLLDSTTDFNDIV